MENFDVVVIGGGPAGAVASAYLNKMNDYVLVLEKETFPRFVIGESLLPCCMNHLEEVGLIDVVKQFGFQKKTGASFYKGKTKCDFSFTEQYTKGWEWTWQVKRKDFDQVLIQEVQRQGVEVKFNSTVTNVSFGADLQLITYKNEQGKEIIVKTKFVIDASGYGRVLPKLLKLNIPSDLIVRGAIFTHVKDENRTEKANDNIFIHSFNNNEAWLWVIPFSDGQASIGVVGKEGLIQEFSANNGLKFKKFIQTFEELKNRFNNLLISFEPKTILGYSIGVKKMYGNGFVLCGNSTEFLDPVFSSGVTLATLSGLQAAKLSHQHINGEKVDWEKDYEQILKKGIDVFRSYIDSWYNGDLQSIFFAENIEPTIKKQICSVLAGYILDETNPFVKKHKTIISTLAKVIAMK